MNGERVLIIGAGGFLGAHLSLHLSQVGYEVTAHCFHLKEKNHLWETSIQHFIYGDITSPDTIKQLSAEDYDYVIYLISLNHFDSEGEIQQVANTNILPLWKLVDKFKNRVKKFIYFSTQQVYGCQISPIVSEDCPPAPINTYGLTHLLCENILSSFNRQSNTQYINVRLSNGYGAPVFPENNCWWLVINDLCKTAFNEKCIRLQSDGSPQRDFIHVKDIAQAIHTLLKQPLCNNLYNLSSGMTYTIGEIAIRIKDIFKERYQTEIPILIPAGKTLQTKTSNKNIVSNKLLSAVGFEPSIDINTGILSIFDYFGKECTSNIK